MTVSDLLGKTLTSPLLFDTDGDRLSDVVGPKSKRTCNAAETDPRKPDSDGGAYLTAMKHSRTNPNNSADDMNPLRDDDTDGDGLTNREEDANSDGVVDEDETDPNQIDTDGDGIGDGIEIRAGYSPLNADTMMGLLTAMKQNLNDD